MRLVVIVVGGGGSPLQPRDDGLKIESIRFERWFYHSSNTITVLYGFRTNWQLLSGN